MSIVDKIQALCEEKGITFAALERSCDLSNGSIRRWEKSIPSIDKLEKIADYFKVSTDYLLGRTDNPSTILVDNFDTAFFKIMQDAKESGLSSHDLKLAIEFLKEARKRDGENINE